MVITNHELENIIRVEYLKDKQAQQVLEQSTEGFKETSDKLILFKRLVYVSEHQWKDIIWMYHDKLLEDHWGTHKTIEAIS